MPRDRQLLLRLRDWASLQLTEFSAWLYELAAKIDPGPEHYEICPDCQTPIVLNRDGTCPQCNDRADQQRRDDEIYQSGYLAAMDDYPNAQG